MRVQNYILTLFKKTPYNNIIKSSDKLEIVKGSGTTFLMKIIGLVFSYGFNILFARLYGADVMGLFALAITLAGVFSLFAQMGTESSIVRFVAQYAGQGNFSKVKTVYKKNIQLVLPLSIFFAVLFYIMSPWFANSIFHKPKLIAPLRITAFMLPFGALMGINTATLQGLKKIKDAFIFSTILPPVLNTVGLVGLTYFVTRNYLTPIYVNLITVVIGALFSLQLWNKWAKSIKIDDKVYSSQIISIVSIFKVTFPMLVIAAMTQIINWTDTIMLGIFIETKYIGIYRIAFKIALLINFILISANSIGVPKYSELFWNSNKNDLIKISKFISKLIFWLSLPLYLFIILFNKKILAIFGEEFVAGSDVLVILATGIFLSSFIGQGGYIMNMVGLERITKNISISMAFLNVVLNYILIKRYNIIGAALSSAFTYVIWSSTAAVFTKKKLGFWAIYFPTIKSAELK
jgi:O-antigen/teichoic acid export membrane protein